MTIPSSPPSPDHAIADALTRALFEPHDFGRVHEPWRRLIAEPGFRYQCGLSDQERIELSYERLRAVNAQLEHPLALVADPVRLAGMHEWIGAADPSCATLATIHHNLFLGSLHEADPQPQRHIDTQHTGVFLVTEVARGNDAPNLSTIATWDPATQAFELNTPNAGAQKFMPNASHFGGPKDGLVAARLHMNGTDQGAFLFHVPLTRADGTAMPGIRIRLLPERAGWPVDHGLTAFHRVRLPAHALLEGDHGRLHDDGTFTSALGNPRMRLLASIRRVTPGKLAMSACGIGMARAALTIAVRYAHHRYISGRPSPVPLIAHRTHAAPLAGHLAAVYAMTFLQRRNVHLWAGHDVSVRDRIERDIALAKAWITWGARSAVVEARERCGAHGMLALNGLAHYAPSLDGAITAEGDNLAIVVKAAAESLFEHASPPAVAPVTAVHRQAADLTDLRRLLQTAEGIVGARARTRFRGQGAKGTLGLARWNQASLPAIEAALVHAAGQAADAFLAAVRNCPDPQARELLGELARLFLLQQLAPYAGALLADGQLTAGAVRSLPTVIEDSIAAVTPHLLTLVQAFSLDGYLASIPLAHPNYQQIYAFPWDRSTSSFGGSERWDPATPAAGHKDVGPQESTAQASTPHDVDRGPAAA
ncbi:acyl-CoA dehydrogenase family protein [Streptomyces chattanoogensis]|uniref:acyl-CoA dehydrogenase family protein n=1 Tax=Streptomyces chattanoogensis TaxID=66876 RepID=UPI003684FD22